MTNYTNGPATAGPNADGSKSLASESKVGIAVQFILTIAATGALSWLANLDTSRWGGWWANTAVAGVAAVTALVSAWLKRNRK